MSTTITPEITARVRVPERMWVWLTGSQVWDEPDTDVLTSLIDKLKNAPGRKDASKHVDLTDGEAVELREWAGYFVSAAGDDMRDGDADARADYNAARATMRQVDKARDTIREATEAAAAKDLATVEAAVSREQGESWENQPELHEGDTVYDYSPLTEQYNKHRVVKVTAKEIVTEYTNFQGYTSTHRYHADTFKKIGQGREADIFIHRITAHRPAPTGRKLGLGAALGAAVEGTR